MKNALESLVMNAEQVLDYEQAAAAISSHCAKLRQGDRQKESLKLTSAPGRILAEPILADRDQPPFPRSTRDGFACQAADASRHTTLSVIGQVRAGTTWNGTLSEGQAIEIMTGAPVPNGADCVVMLEHVQHESSTIRLLPTQEIVAGQNIVAQGAEAKAGSVILAPGTRMSAKEIASAASCGYSEIAIYAKPKVAILATGDELVEIDQQPLAYQIRNSNSYSLAAQVQTAGGEPICLPIGNDNREALRKAIAGIPSVDLLLLSGGVSAGKYDFVEEILAEHNAEFFFTGARIQPGKPIVFGSVALKEDRVIPFFGLPGNPVSTMVTFSLFVQPVLESLGKAEASSPRFALATLAESLSTKTGLTRFLPAVCDFKIPSVRLVPWQGSGDMAAMAHANCYLVIRPNSKELLAGETVKILLA